MTLYTKLQMAGPAVEGADDADRASGSAENADRAERDAGANEGDQQDDAAIITPNIGQNLWARDLWTNLKIFL